MVERVREKLKERRGLKQPGCSWIEVRNQVHVFVSGEGLKGENSNFGGDLKALLAHVSDTNETFF